ncbi:MAG: hypothetical protein KDD61_09655 [Bdellovibrionales bacterium]|nr:hypothetical protein [Bdellovibrionales bacterium]
MFQNKTLILFSFLTLSFTVAVTFNNCSPAEFYMNPQEQSALEHNPFDPPPGEVPPAFDPNDDVEGVNSQVDSVTPQNPFTASDKDQLKFIKRCRMEDYEKEKQEAIKQAKEDPNQLTIPVRYAISTGDKMDETALFAHRRSILRHNDDGKTLVYIGPHDQMIYRTSQGAAHYIADHTHARTQYLSGERCFFSTMTIQQFVQKEIRLNGNYNHNWAILHYGNNYTGEQAKDRHLSPRLFAQIKNLQTPQVIPLYVADIRDKILPDSTDSRRLLSEEFASSASRRKEYEVALKKLFHLDHLFERRLQFLSELSFDRKVKGDSGQTYQIDGYDGVPQLIDNIIFGNKGTVLGIQYTPIALDLGQKSIRTSSVNWGSFFNLANLKMIDPAVSPRKISHMTAWIGGYLQNKGKVNSPFWQREAEDGLLVRIKDGQSGKDVLSAEQLFGQSLEIDGKVYENGFLALQALSGKDCKSHEIKDRYLGPWDKAYHEELRIWIDKNRNGVVDEQLDELGTLESHKIAALGACNIVHRESEDQFGNRTHLRSAFLLAPDLSDISQSEEDILHRIKEGETLDGQVAEFRVMIDILFQTHPINILQDLPLEKIALPEEVLESGTTENDPSNLASTPIAIN